MRDKIWVMLWSEWWCKSMISWLIIATRYDLSVLNCCLLLILITPKLCCQRNRTVRPRELRYPFPSRYSGTGTGHYGFRYNFKFLTSLRVAHTVDNSCIHSWIEEKATVILFRKWEDLTVIGTYVALRSHIIQFLDPGADWSYAVQEQHSLL